MICWDSTDWLNYGTFGGGGILHNWWPKTEGTTEDGTGTNLMNLYKVHSYNWFQLVYKWIKPHPSMTWNCGTHVFAKPTIQFTHHLKFAMHAVVASNSLTDHLAYECPIGKYQSWVNTPIQEATSLEIVLMEAYRNGQWLKLCMPSLVSTSIGW